MRPGCIHILIFFLLLFVPQQAFSDVPVSTPNFPMGTFSKLCAKEIVKGGFTGNIIRCVNKIVTVAGDRLLSTYVRFFATIVYYAVILAIMFHGMRMMFGVAKHHGVTILMILKIVVVLYFCSADGFAMLRKVRTTLIDFPKAMTVAILAGEEEGPLKSVPLLGVLYSVGAGVFADILPTYTSDQIFDRLDLQFCKLLGGGRGATTDADIKKNCAAISSDSTKMFSLILVLAGLFFTGGMGAAITVVALTYLASILLLAAHVILFFVIIALAINFLMAIAPLALACMLFEPTARITKIWFNMLIAYSLQPIVMAAFLLICVTVFQDMMTVKKAEMSKLYESVHSEFDNSGGDQASMVSVFNCMGMNTNINKTAISNKSTMYDFISRSFNQLDQNAARQAGTGTASDIANPTKKACNFAVHSLKLNSLVASVGTGITPGAMSGLSDDDIRKFMALNIAMVIFVVIMISLMTAIPEIVNKIVNPGGGDLSAIAGAAGHRLLNADGGSMVEKISGKGRNLIKNATGAPRH